MTTIIAIQNDQGVMMLADSQITASGKPYFHDDMTKIIERNGYLIAVAGHLVALQSIHHLWEPPSLKSKYKGSLYSFVITKVIPSLRSFANDHQLIPILEDEPAFSILLAINGEVFEIDQDFSVSRSKRGLYAIGTGADYALASLMAGVDIYEAMSIAAMLDINTHPPFLSVTQDRTG
jgi:ATP-dependent protease HslVU (ClpYQ) peptidase subunit